MMATELDQATAEWSRAKIQLERLQGRQARGAMSDPMLLAAQRAFDKACRRRAMARQSNNRG